jgi:hypothetical protein
LDAPTADDLGVSAGKLRIVVSSSSAAVRTSLDVTVVISPSLTVVMISVCFMNPVNISNLSSSDIRGLVAAPDLLVTVTAAEGVVNRLNAGRLLLPCVVWGWGSVVARVGAKNAGVEEGPRGFGVFLALVVWGIGSVVVEVVLRGRKGGRIGRNLFLNLFLRLNGCFVDFSSGLEATVFGLVPNPESLRSPDDRTSSVTPPISFSSTLPSLSRLGTSVSDSIGLSVVDRLLPKN